MLETAQQRGYNTVRALAIADGWLGDGAPPEASYPFQWCASADSTPGGRYGRFDLSRFDASFWRDFADFLDQAETRGLVVISELFGVSGPFAGDGMSNDFSHNYWHEMNSVGGGQWQNKDEARRDFFDPSPVTGSMHAVQEAILDHYLAITSRHDNIVYQPVNEMFGSYSGLNTRTAAQFMDWVRDRILAWKPEAVVLLNTRDNEVMPDYGVSTPGYAGVTIHAPSLSNVGRGFSLEGMIYIVRTHYHRDNFIGFDEDVGRPYANLNDYQDYQRRVAWTTLTMGSGMYIILENIFVDEPWCCRDGNPNPRVNPDRDLPHLVRFLAERQVEPWDMAPANLVVGGVATAMARSGEEILIYLREGASFEIDLSAFVGRFTSEWYDPRTGEFGPLEIIESGGRSASFDSPSGEGDWVFLLRRAGDTEDTAAAAAADSRLVASSSW